ncbi:DUF2970 domain-containing protein [Shewanella glacialipiscicola]|uniref:DUF2970 domain-containing protein n=1 Tax=Shewanella glacialipiscicola TaxID=614069 RepID=UPI0021D99683|nr:DUF2970 domain-containing protein [Shewanella glacialipiscicola]MCU7995324.1 DUF2970 domain-containing protein [Shewanella glacialipiscicola]MCU8026667.1 DUF2970 domain-containing protein [Shewanella glacialipiscicola]
MLSRIWRVFHSTLAAFFGVQTHNNRQKDFQAGSPIPYIIMGIILAVILVASLISLVGQVLS